jgi:hypothetical protein
MVPSVARSMTHLNLRPGCQQLCHAAAPTIDMKRNEGIVMKSKALGLLAAALMGVSGVVGAAPVLVGTTTDPTGINGLVVDGTTYGVAFSTTTLNTFTYGTTLSADASNALASALNTLGVTSLGGGSASYFYFVDVDNSLATSSEGTICLTAGTQCNPASWYGSGIGAGYSLGLGGSGQVYMAAADFSPAAVPVPAAIWLILSGLAGLGLTGWRRGQTAAV